MGVLITQENTHFAGLELKVHERINGGHKCANSLDSACREHDIYYSKNKKIAKRNIAYDIQTQKQLALH